MTRTLPVITREQIERFRHSIAKCSDAASLTFVRVASGGRRIRSAGRNFGQMLVLVDGIAQRRAVGHNTAISGGLGDGED